MDHYITGNAIRELREKKKITQKSLAQTLGVSDKTISKWETGKGYPDISLLEPLAAALDISVAELLSGDYVTIRTKWEICFVVFFMYVPFAAMSFIRWENAW